MFHAAGCPSVDSGTFHCFWPFILMTFFYRRRQSKPSVSKGLHFFTFHFANKQGASAVFSTLNSGESTIFFSSGRRPWIISKMWLYVYLPLCAVALRQVTTSQCHIDTTDLAPSSSPDGRRVYCSFSKWPAARSHPYPHPKSGYAFNHCKLTGSELMDTKLS